MNGSKDIKRYECLKFSEKKRFAVYLFVEKHWGLDILYFNHILWDQFIIKISDFNFAANRSYFTSKLEFEISEFHSPKRKQ